MTNEELLNEYEIAVAIFVSLPDDKKGNSEERMLKIREEVLKRMK